MELTVSKLRYILNAAIGQLEYYNDSDVVLTKTNTSYVNMPFLGTKYGFIDLDNIEVEEPWDEDEDEYWDPNVDESRKPKSLRDRKLETRIHRLEKLLRK